MKELRLRTETQVIESRLCAAVRRSRAPKRVVCPVEARPGRTFLASDSLKSVLRTETRTLSLTGVRTGAEKGGRVDRFRRPPRSLIRPPAGNVSWKRGVLQGRAANVRCWVHMRLKAEMGRGLMRLRRSSRNRSALPPFPRRFDPRQGQCSWFSA